MTRDTWPDLADARRRRRRRVHLAGVNRGDDDEVEHGNVALAEDVAAAVRGRGAPGARGLRQLDPGRQRHPLRHRQGHGGRDPRRRCGPTGTPWSTSGCPTSSASTAGRGTTASSPPSCTPSRAGETPEVTDRPVELLHAQGAAQALIDALTTDAERARPARHRGRRAGGARPAPRVRGELRHAASSPTSRPRSASHLFNTYRAALFPQHYPIAADAARRRPGRARRDGARRGGEGQTCFSTTRPGVTRGEHFHLSKIERFASCQGRATIALRRMFDDEVVDVRGHRRRAVRRRHADHVGAQHHQHRRRCALTLFWTNELFRPERPDTFPDPVRRRRASA